MAQWGFIVLASVGVINLGLAQALMLCRVVGDAAVSALSCGHGSGLEGMVCAPIVNIYRSMGESVVRRAGGYFRLKETAEAVPSPTV